MLKTAEFIKSDTCRRVNYFQCVAE